MRRFLLVIGFIAVVFFWFSRAQAQTNQVVTNGNTTLTEKFPTIGCSYNWTNNAPAIGLPASGSGNIGSFIAKNPGTSPIVATITATPSSPGFAYITNRNDGTVSIINTTTNAVLPPIPAHTGPEAVAISPDKTRLYVSNYNSSDVTVIDLTTNTVITNIPGIGAGPIGIVTSKDGKFVYVASTFDSRIYIIDASTNTLLPSVADGYYPTALVMSPDGSKIYESNFDNTVTVFNTATNTVDPPIFGIGSNPQGMAISPDGSTLYVVDYNDGKVSFVNTTTYAVTSVGVGNFPIWAAVSPDGSTLYVTVRDDNKVAVINTATQTVIDYIDVGNKPLGISVSEDGNMVFVTNVVDNTVTEINAISRKVIGSPVPVGSGPISYGNFVTGCTPITFTITVQPTSLPPSITAGPVSGSISACEGAPSFSPDIAHFTVSGSDLTTPVVVTPSNRLQVSLTSAGPYQNSLSIPLTGGKVANTIVYIRSSPFATAGVTPGTVTMSSNAAVDQVVHLNYTVNSLPNVNPIGDQTIATGTPTTPVSFAGTANLYKWTNDTQSIGLAASGTGDIASFTATNTGNTQVKATVVATPYTAPIAYIANKTDGTVSVINTVTNKDVVPPLHVGTDPIGVAVSPVGNRAYVTNNGSSNVSVIDTKANTVIGTIPTDTFPVGLCVSPDGATLYVVSQSNNLVDVIDVASHTKIAHPTVGTHPYGIAVSPDGTAVYVANYGSNTVSVISTATNAVVANPVVGSFPVGITVSPDGSRIYVANQVSNTVSVINGADNSLLAPITAGTAPVGVTLSPDGSILYVSNAGSNNVSVIDAATGTKITDVQVGQLPYGISVSHDGSLVYVANYTSGDVYVIRTFDNTVVAHPSVGQNPYSTGNFITGGVSCGGLPTTFHILVNPSTLPTITAGSVTGSITGCAGTASSSPNIERFTVSGTNLTENIIATAPAGFEISFSAATGYTDKLTINEGGGTANPRTIYIRSSDAATGAISGKVVLTSAGAVTQNKTVAGIVNPLPTVNQAADQVKNNGDATDPVNFTGRSNTFNWTNDQPGIGLSNSGTGDIKSFIAKNTTSSPIVAHITVTPSVTPYFYVANANENTLSIINPITHQSSTIGNVGLDDPYGVAVTPDGTRVYVVDNNTVNNIAHVTIIDAATNTVIARPEIGDAPNNIALTPDGKYGYITNGLSDNVSVLNTATNTIIKSIPVPAGSYPYGIVISPDASRIYISDYNGSSISVIDPATNTHIGEIAVGVHPLGLAINADGTRLYVANSTGNTVSVIDLNTGAVIASPTVGNGPYDVQLTPDGSKLYVSNYSGSTFSIINTATNTVIRNNIPTGLYPWGISFSPDGSLVYIASTNDGFVYVYDTASNLLANKYPIGKNIYPHAWSFGALGVRNVGCTGAPMKFTITINPSVVTPGIVVSAASGNVIACAGNPSASPDIEQFNVSGTVLTNDIVVTAPANFELSLSAASGYKNTITLQQTGGKVSNTTIYVRSTAAAPTGQIAGNVTLASTGSPAQTVAVSGFINTLPNANKPTDAVYNNNDATTAIKFTGTANTYTWTNDKPGIGLSATGTGDIASFTAVNTTASPIVATVTLTPITAALAYVANEGDNSISVINTVTNKVINTIKLAHSPSNVIPNKDGTLIYICNYVDNSVSIYNTGTNKLIVTKAVGPDPEGEVLSPDGTFWYVVSRGANRVTVFSTATNAIVKLINVQQDPYGIAISPDGSRLYVTNQTSNSVSVIDAATQAVITNIPIGTHPYGIIVNSDGSKVYACNYFSNTVSVISTATNTVSGTLTTGTNPNSLALNADGSLLYVTNAASNSVSVFNTVDNTPASTFSVGQFPNGIQFTADGSKFYVINDHSETVSVVNASNNAIIGSIPTGTAPVAFGKWINAGTDCSSTPVTFTITINPDGFPPTITAGTATGNITACAGSPSASPNIQQFTVSGSGLTGDITVTAPAGFQISLSPGAGYRSNNLIFKQTAGQVNSTIVYVRSAAASAKVLNGNVLLISPGAAIQKVAVSGVINELPTVDAVADQVKADGDLTDGVKFTGTGNVFNWTNDNPAVGLAATGKGDIAAFTAINKGTTPIKANVTVTPTRKGFAFITSSTTNTVSVINTSTKAIEATVTVGANPYGVVASPDGKKVYISNLGGKSVSVISSDDLTATPVTIPVGDQPLLMSISKDGSRLFVSNQLSGTISVINTATNQVINTIPGLSGATVSNADGSLVYVTANLNHVEVLAVVNPITNAITATIPIDHGQHYATASADGSKIYVTSGIPPNQPGTVSIINTADNSVNTVPAGISPACLAVSPDGSHIYVASFAATPNTITIINTATHAIEKTIPINTLIYGVSVSSDGGSLYIANTNANTVSIVDIASGTIVQSIPVGKSPVSIGAFITKGNDCPGIPVKFTITVNPKTAAAITASTASGTITACAGSPSASPNVQQFTISGNGLTAGITATAPTGFEISLASGNGFSANVVIPQTAGVASNTIVYVRSSAAATGTISGNVALTSTGVASQNVAVNGVVNDLPTVNTVADQTKTNGDATDAVTFTGTGNTFTWTNDTPGIGLAANGTGDIASFKAVNTGKAVVKATINATPMSVGFAYIANHGDGTVSIINTLTREVVSTIKVGQYPMGVAVSPDDSKAYVANFGSANISVINTTTNQVVNTISAGATPLGVNVSPNGQRLYVANDGASTVTVVNTANSAIIATIPVKNPYHIVCTPDGKNVYVVSEGSSTVVVIDAVTNKITATIPVGISPWGICISPDGTRAYVANSQSNNISIISTSDNKVIANVATGNSPTGISISPDGSLVYVANQNTNDVSVISTSDNKVIATIAVGKSPFAVSISSDGTTVYVTNYGGDNVSVIDAKNDKIISTINVGAEPNSVGNFITKGTNCPGTPIKFTITVNPSNTPPTITAGIATGTIVACVGTASSSPQIEQFTVSGSNLTADILAIAPTGFEVSLTAGTGYAGSVPIKQVGGIVTNVVVYIRSSSTAPAGNISGNVVLTSTGAASQNVSVSGVVNPLPTVNPIANQIKTNGDNTNPVTFTGAGNTFTWTNDKPGIGLAAGGTGNIASFKAINTGTTPITATITATSSHKGLAYITSKDDGTVWVINTSTNKPVGPPIKVGENPTGLVVSPDGSTVYVANAGDNTVSVIDAATNTLKPAITDVGAFPCGMVMSPDGSVLYVANLVANTISVISTATGKAIVPPMPTYPGPQGIAISPDGSTLYVADQDDSSVDVFSTKTYTQIVPITVGQNPHSVCVSPDGKRVYVVNTSSNTLSVIDGTNNVLIGDIPVGNEPFTMTISPDGAYLYIANAPISGTSTLSIFSTATNTIVKDIDLLARPYGISISQDGNLVYVVNTFGQNSVSVIDTRTQKIVGNKIPVGGAPASFGSFVTGTSCDSAPVTFTITINPASLSTAVTFGPTIGNIFACVGTPSASPAIQHFTVSGSDLQADIRASAPPDFEVALAPNGPFKQNVTLTQTNGIVNNALVYVRSSSTITGNASESIVLSTTGILDQTVPVKAFINTLPTVNTVPDQTKNNGDPTDPVGFTGTGNTFTWTNNTTAIGLAANGVGDIATFKATNTTAAQLTATITVTPTRSPVLYLPNAPQNAVSVINGITGQPIIPDIPVGNNPNGLTLSPDGTRAYVSNGGSNNISVINTLTNTVIAPIPLSSSPNYVEISPDGNWLYVANWNANTVSVINANTYAVVATVNVETKSVGITGSPDGKTLYITYGSQGMVAVIDIKTNALITKIKTEVSPQGIFVSPDGSRIYVSNFGSNTVSVIDAATNAVIKNIQVGLSPRDIKVMPDGSKVYVLNTEDNTISVIDAASNGVLTTFPVDNHPYAISISPDGTTLGVTSIYSYTATLISTATNAVINSFRITSNTLPDTFGNFLNNGAGCAGDPVTFHIIVNPATPAVITASGTLTGLTTTYGTPSSTTSFTVSGASMTEGILVTPPPGFEVSTDGVNFSPTVTVGGSGTIAQTTVYVRLKATTPVGSYAGNVVLTSSGAAAVNVPTSNSTVMPALLTIVANSVHKPYGSVLTGAGAGSTAFTPTGLQNGESVGSVTITYGTGSAAADAAGTYIGRVTPSAATGGTFDPMNYTLSYQPGDIIVDKVAVTIIADDHTREYAKPNPFLSVTYMGFVNGENENNLTTKAIATTIADINYPPGQYPISVDGAASPNYTFTYVFGVLTISQSTALIKIPNAFTPNGDGINDVWNINSLISYPNCTVQVYNRYGENVYSSIGYAIPWNGLYRGTLLPTDAYYYVINLKDGSNILSGYVTLIR